MAPRSALLLRILQILAALLYGASGIMKVFMSTRYLSGVLGLLMAFIAYGRMVLKPILNGRPALIGLKP